MGGEFVSGVELCRGFYFDAVGPLLRRYFGDLSYSAGRVGAGSEVAGFDTSRSVDHDWGPRVQIFLRPEAVDRYAGQVRALLSERLPKSFLGYPTNFASGGGEHVRHMRATDGPVHHGVDVTDLGTWFVDQLGFDPRAAISSRDWLGVPTQALVEVTAGAVFHDGLGELVAARERLRWYPADVWRYVLACQWQRISQEEAFVGRCGEVGDELGSAVVAARLVRDLMRLCLLMARRYPPYSKWLGSAFARLPCAAELTPTLTAAVAATDWRDRQRYLAQAYETVAAQHNQLELTEPVDPTVRPYHDRPFLVLHAERFRAALMTSITDPDIRALPLIGAIDQYADSTDVLRDRRRTQALARAQPSGGGDDR